MRTANAALVPPNRVVSYRAASVAEPPRYRAATARERYANLESLTSVPPATPDRAKAIIEDRTELEQILSA